MSFNDINPYLNEYPKYEEKSGMNDSIHDRIEYNEEKYNKVVSSDKINHKKSGFKTLDDIKVDIIRDNEESENKDIEKIKEDIMNVMNDVSNTSRKTARDLDDQGEDISEMIPRVGHISDNLDRSDSTIDILKNRFNKFAFWRAWKSKPKLVDNKLPSEIKREEIINNKINPNDNNTDVPDNLDSKKQNGIELLSKIDTSIFGIGSLLGYNVSQESTGDEFCDALIKKLEDVKQTNIKMGAELDAQNDTLHNITKAVHGNNKHITEINRGINRLIR